MEIKRDLYLKQLIERRQNGLIKVITGIRRCGKSYLLNTLFYNYLKREGVDESHIVKFAFDSNSDLNKIGENIIALEREKRKVDPNKFMEYVQNKMTDNGTYYLLLDEVQLLDCFESVLNSYLHMDNVDVYVTGSNAKFLSKDVITEFAGRGDEVHMQPLSFVEFMSVYKGDKYDGLTEYMLYGGIPMVVLREGAENKSLMLKRLFDEIYIKDIVLRHKVRNKTDLEDLLKIEEVQGVATNYFERRDLFKVKRNMEEAGIEMNTFKSAIPFSEFKTDDKGLVPCIVQDYRTGQVLMLAYMNEESYQATCETGKMTYFSRSRQKLWCKGDTSGHYQYVKELSLDCDNDTILAKVHQVGAACHTGSYSCFFKELAKKDYIDTNPLTILQEDFETIENRKKNPKEGSYTNYLFTQGIDKILKKCGEEASEIIIAAKNPNAEELKYEIADFLYHMMVLMAECGLTWEDITRELANRR